MNFENHFTYYNGMITNSNGTQQYSYNSIFDNNNVINNHKKPNERYKKHLSYPSHMILTQQNISCVRHLKHFKHKSDRYTNNYY